MNTVELEQRKNKLLYLIEKQLGELEDGDYEELTALDSLIQESYQEVGLLIVQKAFDERIAKFKEAKRILDAEIKKIEKIKNYTKFKVHKWLLENGSQEIQIDGITKHLVAGQTTKREINIEEVNLDIGKVTIILDADNYNELCAKGSFDVYEMETAKRKVLLADLEPNHPAIKSYLNPSIKLNKNA